MLVILISSIVSVALASDQSDTTTSDTDAKFIVSNTLSGAGIKDVSLTVADGRPNGGEKVLVLTYNSEAFDIDGVGAETAKILGAFLGAVGSGWDGESLMVVVGDITGKVALATWYCSKEWTESYIHGDMTEKDILFNVLKTIGTV